MSLLGSRNAYTQISQQHSDLFLGSLQLLVWLFLRPSAWSNHLRQIDPSLSRNSGLLKRSHGQNPALQRLVLQGWVILPLLINLIMGVVMLKLGTPVSEALLRVTAGLAIALTVGVIGGITGIDIFSTAEGVAVGTALGAVTGLIINGLIGVAASGAIGLTGDLSSGAAFGAAAGLSLGLAKGLGFGAAKGRAFDPAEGVSLGMVFGIFASAGLSLILDAVGGLLGATGLGIAQGLAAGLSFGMAFTVGVTVHGWRPILSYLIFLPWQALLFGLDRYRFSRSHGLHTQWSLLKWHPAFWDEWQYLPLWGLDHHILLVLQQNPIEGEAALRHLNTSRQSWVVRAVRSALNRQAALDHKGHRPVANVR